MLMLRRCRQAGITTTPAAVLHKTILMQHLYHSRVLKSLWCKVIGRRYNSSSLYLREPNMCLATPNAVHKIKKASMETKHYNKAKRNPTGYRSGHLRTRQEIALCMALEARPVQPVVRPHSPTDCAYFPQSIRRPQQATK